MQHRDLMPKNTRPMRYSEGKRDMKINKKSNIKLLRGEPMNTEIMEMQRMKMSTPKCINLPYGYTIMCST